MKRLMEGKEFTVAVKCSVLKVVSFNGPIIFVSNEHSLSDKRFLCRVLVVCANRKWREDDEELCFEWEDKEDEWLRVLRR